MEVLKRLCGTVSYAFARSNQTTVRSPFVFFVSLISCEMTLMCSRHPWIPCIPPFFTDVSIRDSATRQLQWFLLSLRFDFKARRRQLRGVKLKKCRSLPQKPIQDHLSVCNPSICLYVSFLRCTAPLILGYQWQQCALVSWTCFRVYGTLLHSHEHYLYITHQCFFCL